eukprot:6077453-Pleurochrysis_carterae.AAC.1
MERGACMQAILKGRGVRGQETETHARPCQLELGRHCMRRRISHRDDEDVQQQRQHEEDDRRAEVRRAHLKRR